MKRKGFIPEEILNEEHDPIVFDKAMDVLLHTDIHVLRESMKREKEERKRLRDERRKGKK